MSSLPPTDPGWSIIVPVKQTTIAKSRLRGFAERDRRALAMAFALDTISAALASPEVRRLVVVTNDPAAHAFRDMGADVIEDRPDAGLNAAIVHGARAIHARNPESGLVALAGDLPALSTAVLSMALSLATSPRWFVPDSAGTGTTLLAAVATEELTPHFGPHSRAFHRAGGAQEITGAGLERLRRDVDTEADLWDAIRLGVGPHTRDVVSGLDRERLA